MHVCSTYICLYDYLVEYNNLMFCSFTSPRYKQYYLLLYVQYIKQLNIYSIDIFEIHDLKYVQLLIESTTVWRETLAE